MSFVFVATATTTTVKAAEVVEAAPLEPIQEEVVEEFKTTLESPSGTQSETQEVVEDVNSPSPFASPGYSNIFSFPTDNTVDKFLQGAGTGIFIDFYF